MQANSYLTQNMQGRWRVFLLIRDMEGWVTMRKMLHHSGGISLTAFRECLYQRQCLASQVWGLSSSLGGLASSKGSLPKKPPETSIQVLGSYLLVSGQLSLLGEQMHVLLPNCHVYPLVRNYGKIPHWKLTANVAPSHITKLLTTLQIVTFADFR